MTKWTPNFSKHVNEHNLRLVPRVRRWLPRQSLDRRDLVLVITNGRWERHGYYIHYSFKDPTLSKRRRERGESAGIDDVTVVVERRQGLVVAVARRWRQPKVRHPRPEAWTPQYRFNVSDSNLRLTRHAVEQMRERRLTRSEVAFVIRHGRCVHRQGQVYYTLLGRDGRDDGRATWQRLSGVVVNLCPHTLQVITVWRGRDAALNRLRHKPKRSRYPWWPSLEATVQ